MIQNTSFNRDDGREISIKVKWCPREPDVGIMQEYVDDYWLPEGEPTLTESEYNRLIDSQPEWSEEP